MTNQKIKVVVTGACGYIGSHTLVDLIQSGYEVISIDSLDNSQESVLDAVNKITGKRVKNYAVDLSIQDAWKTIHRAEPDVQAIIHFAAFKAVGESVEQPLKYFHNNVGSLLEILKWIEFASIPYLIYSSSCTVYGETTDLPVTESTPFGNASSPYGRTKQIGEWMIQDFYKSNKKKAISLRYFNPAGAHESVLIGESPLKPALNLVPIITETAIGKRREFSVYGNDYPTRDGSCERDYIHVMDLASAHTKALDYLMAQKTDLSFEAFNLGIGKPYSVFEMISEFESFSHIKLNYVIGARRPGDVISIYADNTKALQLLKWKPQRDLKSILESAWNWEKYQWSKAPH